MFLLIFSNSCPLNLLLFRSHQAEIIIIKRLIQGRNIGTRMWVEPRSCNHGRCKNDAFTLSTPCRQIQCSVTTVAIVILFLNLGSKRIA